MSIDKIQQTARSIVEAAYRYETLLERKGHGKKVDRELSKLREYIVTLSRSIKLMVDEENV